MSNEAAERLRNDLAFAAPEIWMLHIERRMQEHADAERRATVERIRRQVQVDGNNFVGEIDFETLDAILDAEAAR